ncbi:MAG: hypothetical protein K6E91_01205 [Butyrivibrio sp.]|nr:hypothetical protein [Butyrivibrio sp.]
MMMSNPKVNRDMLELQLGTLFQPKMREILKEKYVDKNVEKAMNDETLSAEERERNRKIFTGQMTRVMNEAVQACDDILDLVSNTRFKSIFNSGIATMNKISNLNYLIRQRPERLIVKLKGETFTGRRPSDMEIIKALEGIYSDIEQCFKDLKEVRELDIDSKEVPVPGECISNAKFVTSIRGIDKDKKNHAHISYSGKTYILSKPEEVRQYLIKNMDVLASTGETTAKEKEEYLKELKAMNFKGKSFAKPFNNDQKNIEAYISELPADIRKLVDIAMQFSKFECHEAATVISDEEDGKVPFLISTLPIKRLILRKVRS